MGTTDRYCPHCQEKLRYSMDKDSYSCKHGCSQITAMPHGSHFTVPSRDSISASMSMNGFRRIPDLFED